MTNVVLVGQHQMIIPDLMVFLVTKNRKEIDFINELIRSDDVKTFALEKLENGGKRMNIVLTCTSAYAEISKYMD